MEKSKLPPTSSNKELSSNKEFPTLRMKVSNNFQGTKRNKSRKGKVMGIQPQKKKAHPLSQ
jgi:hypothetical protein